MTIELLYFDGCPNWSIAAGRLRQAALLVGRPGEIEYRRIETPEEAAAAGFRGSPTVRIDGRDPFEVPGALVGLSCRMYETPAGLAGAPTLEQLTAALS